MKEENLRKLEEMKLENEEKAKKLKEEYDMLIEDNIDKEKKLMEKNKEQEALMLAKHEEEENAVWEEECERLVPSAARQVQVPECPVSSSFEKKLQCPNSFNYIVTTFKLTLYRFCVSCFPTHTCAFHLSSSIFTTRLCVFRV